MTELAEMNATALRSGIEHGDFTAREVAEAAIRRIDAVEPRVRALLLATPDLALRQADAIDALRAAGDPLPSLAGVTIALKDNLCTEGTRTTAGSRILHNFVPPYSATVVKRIAAAGAMVMGKANLDEFAMGSSTENSGFHTTRNPWDLERVPGGSSGGSAAAVAACETTIALGSDTGGSIRQPASLCGVVGMKPTYGRVSRYGLIAYASSLDQIGPLGRTVQDCARLLGVIAGHDACDSTSANIPSPDYEAACGGSVKGLRIGVPKEFFEHGVQAEVADAVMNAVQTLVELGATVEECSLPHTEYGLAAYYILAPAECSSNLARFDGVKYGLRTRELAGHIGLTEKTRDEGFGAEVKQRIMIGTYTLSAGYYDAYYKKAQQTRTLIRRDYDEAFQKFDVIATPTSPIPAFKIGETADPLAMKLNDVCTLPVNMAGLPAISVPCGFVNGLPVGLQLIGKAFDEETLFRAAHAYEQATEWHKALPVIA